MWWRIELDKKGVVIRCDEVEQPERNARYVRYIEAETGEGASKDALAWVAARRAHARSNYQRNITKGECVKRQAGCTVVPVPGKRSCQKCLDRGAVVRSNIKKRRAAGDIADHRRKYASADEARQAALDRRRATGERIRHELSTGRLVRQGDWLAMPYAEALALFDQLGPEMFRAWLVEGAEQAALPQAAE